MIGSQSYRSIARPHLTKRKKSKLYHKRLRQRTMKKLSSKKIKKKRKKSLHSLTMATKINL